MPRYMRQIIHIIIAACTIIIFGTVGYCWVEGWPLDDAIYMTIITVTTVGYEEVAPLSSAGRLFTSVLILFGFSIFAVLCSQFAQIIVEGEFSKVFGRQKMDKKIKKLKGHFIICGYGRVGSTVCKELKDQGAQIVVAEVDKNLAEQAIADGHLVVLGNAISDNILLKAEIKSATTLLSLTSNDSVNLFITLSARELNPLLYIISRGEGGGIESKLLRAGADVVISPFQICGRQIANLVSLGSGHENIGQESIMGTNVGDYQLRMYHYAGSRVTTVGDIQKQSQALSVISLERPTDESITSPALSEIVHPNESLILLFKKNLLELTPDDQPFSKTLGKKVLIADDHLALLKLHSKKIQSAGYEVLTATDGEAALALCISEKPELIILDVMMPKMNGYDVCLNIRKHKEFQQTPLILYSNIDPNELRRKGKEAGATLCLEKTAKSSELLSVIDKFFSTKET